MSAQKALQGSETETRELQGGTTENSVSPMRGDFLQKRKQKKMSLWSDLAATFRELVRPVHEIDPSCVHHLVFQK